MGDAAPEDRDGHERAHQLPEPGKRAGHVVGALADDQQHLVDPREVHGRRQLRVVEQRGAAVVDGAHPPHRDAAREQAAPAGGDDEVADLDAAAVTRHVLEAQGAAGLALHDALGARAHDVRAHRRRGIGEDLDDGGAGPHVDDAADQTVGRDHGGQARDADPPGRG